MKRENGVWYVKFDEWIAFASLEDAIAALDVQ
jgi:hypothetical protein